MYNALLLVRKSASNSLKFEHLQIMLLSLRKKRRQHICNVFSTSVYSGILAKIYKFDNTAYCTKMKEKECGVKKLLLCLGLAIIMLMNVNMAGAAEAQPVQAPANPAGNPIDQLTGKIWQASTESNKESILFGIDLGVAANYFAYMKASEKTSKKGKTRPVHVLSHFDRCWMEAFKNVSRKEAVKMVDDWYAAHPDQLSRPVLGVLWYEVVIPMLKKEAVNQ